MSFPMDFVDPIVASMKNLMNSEILVEPRPLSALDSNTIGVYPTTWLPAVDSHLIGQNEPTLNNYIVQIANVLVHGDDIEGRRLHGADCRSIRAILYRDDGLRVALLGLAEVLFGSVERVKKYNVQRQDFLASRLDIGFTFLCTTDLVIQTETTPQGAP
jgi:hypothetical protein